MNDGDKSTLWVGAFRYYLGRRTYAVSTFCEILIKEWYSLEKDTQDLILGEIEECKNLGDDCDKLEWTRLVRELSPMPGKI